MPYLLSFCNMLINYLFLDTLTVNSQERFCQLDFASIQEIIPISGQIFLPQKAVSVYDHLEAILLLREYYTKLLSKKL
jgi:hypothetical protein